VGVGGRPIAEAAFKAFSVSPIPLSVTDVNDLARDRIVDGSTARPWRVVALQWFYQGKIHLRAAARRPRRARSS